MLLENIINEELKKCIQLFKDVDGCEVKSVQSQDERLKITSLSPVPWSKSLKPQYNEDEDKIGYLFRQSRGIRIDIDFPHETIKEKVIGKIINSFTTLEYSPPNERAPLTRSYWRFKTSPDFDTITLAIRSPQLQKIDLTNSEVKNLFQRIVNLAK
jgi:hypothetical protein